MHAAQVGYILYVNATQTGRWLVLLVVLHELQLCEPLFIENFVVINAVFAFIKVLLVFYVPQNLLPGVFILVLVVLVLVVLVLIVLVLVLLVLVILVLIILVLVVLVPVVLVLVILILIVLVLVILVLIALSIVRMGVTVSVHTGIRVCLFAPLFINRFLVIFFQP